METFALGVTSERKQERLLLALHGRKAYCCLLYTSSKEDIMMAVADKMYLGSESEMMKVSNRKDLSLSLIHI